MTSHTTSPTRRRRAASPSWRQTSIAVLLLGGVFAVALLAPIPAGPNTARAEVMARVEERLPGWAIIRTDSTWEGAWTVVAACGASRLGFQVVPGHGLTPGDAWLKPEDLYTRGRLRIVSDSLRYLVWFDDRDGPSLPCRTELARPNESELPRGRIFD